MNFASVCSGIGGAELAAPDHWESAWYSEIEPFPCRVLDYRFGGKNLGDFTEIGSGHGPVELLAGGPPCQTFSYTGKRGGLADARGNLSLQFADLAHRVRARWVVWENVPGVLSAEDGRAFGSICGALVECGYNLAYRIFDAKFFGLAQQRKRVFLVGYLGDWRPPCAVLFERPRVQGDPVSIQPAGTPFVSRPGGSFAKSLGTNPTGGLDSQNIVSRTLLAKGTSLKDPDVETFVAHTLGASRSPDDGPGAFVASSSKDTGIRKLTPLEYERLQGFPDNWTLIPGASDSARYKAVGNAWPVPVARWIMGRIDQVDKILEAHS